MTPITTSEDEAPIRLGIRTQFALHKHESAGQILYEVKRKQADLLAHKILEHDKFFNVLIDKEYGSMRADVLCFTQEEYNIALKKQFMAGIKHAENFMPTWDK